MKYIIKVLTSIVVTLTLLLGCGSDDSSPCSQENINDFVLGTNTSCIDPVVKDLISFSLDITDSQGISTLNVTQRQPVVVSATLLINNLPQAGVLVKFSLQYGLATIDPSSSTALTNKDGIASIILSAKDQYGSDTITASTDGLNASMSFSVAAQNTLVSMIQPTASPESISSTGSATITVVLNDDTNSIPYEVPVDISFSSSCVDSGLATIESPVATVNGIAQSTYKDIACGQTDTIEVNAKVGSQLLAGSVAIAVQDAAAGSINFISASNDFIALKGTGGSGGGITRQETSVLKFQVVDVNGSPAAFEEVMFALSSNVGNLSLNHSSAQSDADGYAEVIVQSGSVATSIRVIATLASDTSLSTISDLLVISSGVADYNSFSLSVSDFNPEGWAIDGTKVQVTAHVADHFNNPVPDGTAVVFNTEFGQIEPSCTTTNGSCTVTWTSSEPRIPIPEFRDITTTTKILGDDNVCLKQDGTASLLNNFAYPCFYSNASAATINDPEMSGGLGQVYGNRVTIFAHLIGEESFADSNGNGAFDANEAYADISAEGFRDDNEDGVFAGRYSDASLADGAADHIATCKAETGVICLQPGGDNEEYIDFNNNGRFDGESNQLLNSVLCLDENAGCTQDLLPIWKNVTILQAGSFAHISLIERGLDREMTASYYQTVDISAGAKIVDAYVADLHNGRMPSGTTITFAAGNGVIVGPDSCTVLNSSSLGFSSCSVVVKRSESADEVSDTGLLTVIVTTPSGFVTERAIIILD